MIRVCALSFNILCLYLVQVLVHGLDPASGAVANLVLVLAVSSRHLIMITVLTKMTDWNSTIGKQLTYLSRTCMSKLQMNFAIDKCA